MKRIIIRDKVLVQRKDGSSVSLTCRQYRKLREKRSEGHSRIWKGVRLICAPEGGLYFLLKDKTRIGPIPSGWE